MSKVVSASSVASKSKVKQYCYWDERIPVIDAYMGKDTNGLKRGQKIQVQKDATCFWLGLRCRVEENIYIIDVRDLTLSEPDFIKTIKVNRRKFIDKNLIVPIPEFDI